MKSLVLCFLLVFSSLQLYSQEVSSPSGSNEKYLLASPGAMKYGLYGYDNPAILTYVDGFDALFTWSDQIGKWNSFNEWGVFTGVRGLGFGVVKEKFMDMSIYDYKLSTGFGNRDISVGLGYGWSNGAEREFNRTNIITSGLLIRPNQYISFGLTGDFSTSTNYKKGYTELAVRPLGNELVTIFGDYTLRKRTFPGIEKENWSAGAALELLPGIRITGRYFDTKAFTAGIQLSFGNIGFTSQAHYDNDQKYSYNTYGVRIGSYDRNPFTMLFPRKDYLSIELKDNVKYQRYKFFDNSNTLLELLSQIEATKEDKSITGIAINTSGMSVEPEMLWELRDRLADFKKTGKQVIIFIDNTDIHGYHFASIADKIVMDPIGMISMQGLISGRTFYKGTLEKLGIGFNEWRFFKYKSAAEAFAREKMSEGDQEQREKLLDEYYELLKKNISEGRNFTGEKFDNIINNVVVLTANDALQEGLVDTLARWDGVNEVVKTIHNEDRNLTDPGSIEKFRLPSDNHWSEFDKIAVIYALGICDMETGIAARELIKDVEKVTNDPQVKAVVLRVDSPGGDGLASDYIAEAIKRCKKVKPVIVSQGSVAGSGGYWLSMYGDTIVTSPVTITGSIGVIAGWAYNKGFKEKLGFTTDFVKKGEHADLGFGAALPFIGISLPDRDLTKEEFQKAENLIRNFYDDFVAKVSAGRNLSKEYVDSVGQGRIWIGSDAVELNLADTLGSLDTAIKLAKARAGIKQDEIIKIVQYPEMPLFGFDSFFPGFLGLKLKSSTIFDERNETINQLKYRLQNIGVPLIIMPLEDMGIIK